MATPNLALIPSAYKARVVYSVLPNNGDGDFTFVRSGNATRINKDGLIETVDSHVPRLNYDLHQGKPKQCPSLLLEPQRANLLPYSEDFSNSAWAKLNVSVVSNNSISPDGTLNANKIIDNSTNGIHRIQDAVVTNSTGNYTYSIFLKKGTLTTAYFQVFNSGTASAANVDLENGTITSAGVGFNHKIEDYGNDWYRCSISFTSTNTATTVYLYIKQAAAYVGTGEYLYSWGAQLEEGSYPTSYIPTSGSTETRNAEECNSAGNSGTFNDSEGVLMVEIRALADSSDYRFIAVSDGTNSNRVTISFKNNNTLVGFVQGISEFNSNANILNFNKAAMQYKSGDYSFWVNGFVAETSSSTSGTHANLNELKFSMGSDSNDFYGKTKQIQYFDTALTDSQLEYLTSYRSFGDMVESQNYIIQ